MLIKPSKIDVKTGEDIPRWHFNVHNVEYFVNNAQNISTSTHENVTTYTVNNPNFTIPIMYRDLSIDVPDCIHYLICPAICY